MASLTVSLSNLRAFSVTNRERRTIIVCAFTLIGAVMLCEKEWGSESVIHCAEIGPIEWIEVPSDDEAQDKTDNTSNDKKTLN